MSRAQLEPTLSSARVWGGLCTTTLLVALVLIKGYPIALEMGELLRRAVGAVCVVDQIDVKGAVRTSVNDMGRHGHVSHGMSLMDVNVGRVKEALERMPWIDMARVRRVFPGKIVIEVRERTPFGIWDVSGQKLLVSHAGGVIQASPPQDVFLYRLWGREAPQHAPAFMKTLQALDPTFASQVQGLHRQSSGRMDVFLKDGLRVCLPQEGVGGALDVFRRLRKKVSLNVYQSVDLRVRGRAALTPLSKDVP